jgi:formate hydrogenlyase subunit 3/multisubunit Na+/H+ antiporter MnhD subunit
MSLSSFFLLTFEHEKSEVYDAGLNYLVSMHVGVVFLIIGFILLSQSSGSFDFSSFKAALNKGQLSVFTVFVIFFIGFGMKAGFVPLHTWLPRAHPAAPSHISGIMSGIMIKTGIYGIFRVITFIDSPLPEIGYFVLIISLVSGLLGVAYAIAQHNLKKLLAYHSVENIGIIGIGAGLLGLSYHNTPMALLGFSGAILHVLNHAVFKSLLFYAAGIVYHQTHTVDIERLGGLGKHIPFAAAAFLTGAVAISGLPPLNGFISEFFIYMGMFKGLQSGMFLSVSLSLTISGLAFIGAMAMLCFTKAFGVVFLGSPRSHYPNTVFNAGISIKAAMTIQCLMIVGIGLFPAQVFSVIVRIASQFVEIGNYSLGPTLQMLGNLSKGFFIFLTITALLWMLRVFMLRKAGVYAEDNLCKLSFLKKLSLSKYRYKTWDCGYQAGNVRMQYTASSYAAPFIGIIKPVLDYKEQIVYPSASAYRETPKKAGTCLFPVSGSFESRTQDRIETCIIAPVISLIIRFLNLFSWIQSGNIQQYILYGLIFLTAVTLWIMGV